MQYNYNYTVLSPEQQLLLARNNKIINIKKTISGLGFAVFSAEIVLQLLYTLLYLFLAISPASKTEFFQENYVAISELFHGTALFTAMFVIGFLYCQLSNTKLSTIIKFKKIKATNLILYVLLGVSIAFLGNIITSILLSNFEAVGIKSNLPDTELNYNNLGFVIMTLITAVVPAFAEEFLFRGVILGKLRKFGNTFAILCSALLFGLMHGNLVQIPFAFIGGIFFAFITVKTDSLLPAMIIHFLNNFLSCILQIISELCSDYIINITSMILFLLIFASGILSFIILSIKDKKLFKINNETDEAKEFALKEKFKFFFSNVGIIFAIVILLLELISSISFG